jgi:hypothetical protein
MTYHQFNRHIFHDLLTRVKKLGYCLKSGKVPVEDRIRNLN